MDLWTPEREQWNNGYALLCGVDEAGAGPLAGPVYAGAVILPEGLELPYLNDSKQVTPKRRDVLFGHRLGGCVRLPGGDRRCGHPQRPGEGHAAGDRRPGGPAGLRTY